MRNDRAFLKSCRYNLLRIWNQLTGDPAVLTDANRAFNAISIFSLVILLIILPFNLYLGLTPVCIVVGILIVLQSVFYYFSRFRRKYRLSMTVYAITSYLTLILNFFFNSGSLGPTLFLFFLSYQLLIVFTPKRQHLRWTSVHLLVPLMLLLAEHNRPDWVPDTYAGPEDRIFDLSSSYVVVITGVYFMTIYLRNRYRKEKKNAEERANKIEQQNKMLDHLNKEKTRLFSIVSHDLRSPLNSMTGILELLNDPGISPEEHEELKRDLLHISRSTSEMLRNLLSWSSAQIKGVSARFSAVRVNEVVQKVLEVQQLIADKKEVRIERDTGNDLLLTADPDMLELVLRNLLNNAIKFTPPGGRIRIFTGAEDSYGVVAVQDSGIGMSPEQQQQLFSLNARSTYGTNNESGIGLGLLLCREFTEAQQGQIRMENNENGGCTFYVSLPLSTTSQLIN